MYLEWWKISERKNLLPAFSKPKQNRNRIILKVKKVLHSEIAILPLVMFNRIAFLVFLILPLVNFNKILFLVLIWFINGGSCKTPVNFLLVSAPHVSELAAASFLKLIAITSKPIHQ